MKRTTLIGLVAGALAAVTLVPSGAVAESLKDVFVTNTAADPVPTTAVGTVDVSGSEVTVANAPVIAQPWDAVVRMAFSEGGKFSFESIVPPDDDLITIERVSIGDFFGNSIIDLRVIELCDFTDGKNGFGGQIATPIGPTLDPSSQGIDHLTSMVITPGACISISLELQTALGEGVSGFTTVTLSGTQVPVGAGTASIQSDASDDEKLQRSLDDPLLTGVWSPEQHEHARAAARNR